MNRNQRLGLIVAVVAIAVVAFVIAKPGGDDDTSSGTPASDTGSQASGGTDTEAAKPAAPPVNRIAIKGNKVQGGVQTIEVKKGERLRIVVTVDRPETLHLHGWDVEKEAGPGKPARFDVKAQDEGEFELESHTFEHEGLEPAIAKIRVQPA